VRYFEIKPSLLNLCLDVRGSVHHSTIRKEKSNKIQQCINIFIIPYLYEARHVSGDTPSIIRSLKPHWQPLVFHTWKVVWTCSWWTLSGAVLCLTTSTNYMSKQPSTYEKPGAASAVLGS